MAPSSSSAVGSVANGMGLDTVRWMKQVYVFDQALPLGLAMMPASLFILLKGVRSLGLNSGAVYCISIFSISGLLLLALNPIVTTGGRQWLFLLPMVIPFLAYSIGVAGPSLLAKTERNRDRYVTVLVLFVLLAGGVTVNIGAEASAGAQPLSVIKAAYGLPCQETSCDRSVSRQYEHLRGLVAPEDLVISSNPHVSSYYLGKVDGILREMNRDKGYSVAHHYISDDHLDIPTITAAELKDFPSSPTRIWIIVDEKLHYYPDSELQRLLTSEFTVFREDEITTVYVDRGL